MEQGETKQTNDVNLLNMIESRIMEIVQIEDECKRKLPKLYLQRLPRFMRRRAACHNIKRLPKRLRPDLIGSSFGSKDRSKLLKYRRRLRFRKHKRILKKHARHKFTDPDKSLLHKWFAKRFKMGDEGALNHVPLYNNTKNQRNLYRQSHYGCSYLSMGHLIPLKLTLSPPTDQYHLINQLEQLNRLTDPTSGFTFLARALMNGNYEVCVHLYKLDTLPKKYLCPALTHFSGAQVGKDSSSSELTLWVPRNNYQAVSDQLEIISKESTKEFSVTKIYPRDWTRVRLVGPNAFDEAVKLAEDKDKHTSAIEDVRIKLNASLGITMGRHISEKYANFIYYLSKPRLVDIVFKTSAGRMLWHDLIKNKAHLVGGYRDIERVLVAGCFDLSPDCSHQ